MQQEDLSSRLRSLSAWVELSICRIGSLIRMHDNHCALVHCTSCSFDDREAVALSVAPNAEVGTGTRYLHIKSF